MAREQTQDLPTRGLQPANVQGGQYRVAVQQAPESKLIGLARGLSSVNRGLEAYTNMGGTLSEMYEEEIQGKDLLQLEKERNKMADRLDAAQRKGQIPFLGNPLNWERNQRALARQYAARLYEEVTASDGRFNTGKKAGDENLTVGEIIDQERERFLTQDGVRNLQANPIMLDAFNAEWQQRSNILEQRYSDIKTKEMQAETTRSVANSIINGFSDIDHFKKSNKLTDVERDARVAIAEQDIVNKWRDLNALTPANQLRVVREITKMMAETDPQEATDFLEFAKQNLRIGSRLLKDESATIRDIENMIADVESDDTNNILKDLREEDAIAQLQAKNDLNTFTILQARVRNGQTVEWNGSQFSSTQDLRKAFRNHATNIGGARGAALLNDLDEDIDRTPESTVAGQIQQLAERQNDFQRVYTGAFANYLGGLVIDDKQKFPMDSEEAIQLQTEFAGQLNTLKRNLASELATGNNVRGVFGETPEEAQSVFDLDIDGKAAVLNKVYRIEANALLDRYKQRSIEEQQNFIKAEQDRQTDIGSATNLQAVNLRKYTGRQGGKERADMMLANLRVMALGDDTQRKAAKGYFWKGENGYDNDEIREIINGERKYKVEPSLRTYFSATEGAYDVELGGVEYTDEDIEAFKEVYFSVQSLSGYLTTLDQMDPTDRPNIYTHTKTKKDKKGVSIDVVYPINVTELNSRHHRILTQDEVDSNDDSLPSLVKKAKRMGVPPSELLKNQREWYKEHAKFIEMLENR